MPPAAPERTAAGRLRPGHAPPPLRQRDRARDRPPPARAQRCREGKGREGRQGEPPRERPHRAAAAREPAPREPAPRELACFFLTQLPVLRSSTNFPARARPGRGLRPRAAVVQVSPGAGCRPPAAPPGPPPALLRAGTAAPGRAGRSRSTPLRRGRPAATPNSSHPRRPRPQPPELRNRYGLGETPAAAAPRHLPHGGGGAAPSPPPHRGEEGGGGGRSPAPRHPRTHPVAALVRCGSPTCRGPARQRLAASPAAGGRQGRGRRGRIYRAPPPPRARARSRGGAVCARARTAPPPPTPKARARARGSDQVTGQPPTLRSRAGPAGRRPRGVGWWWGGAPRHAAPRHATPRHALDGRGSRTPPRGAAGCHRPGVLERSRSRFHHHPATPPPRRSRTRPPPPRAPGAACRHRCSPARPPGRGTPSAAAPDRRARLLARTFGGAALGRGGRGCNAMPCPASPRGSVPIA